MTVLFLTHRLPYAANRGDRTRANYIVRALADVADVHLASLVHSREEASQAPALAPYVASLTLARVPAMANRLRAAAALAEGDRPLTHVLLDAPDLRAALRTLVETRRPDVVLAYCSSMAAYALDPPLSGIPLVLDLVDVDSSKWRALAERMGGWRRAIYRREARVLLPFERLAASRATATLVVNERERQEAIAAGISGPIVALPHGIDVDYLRPATPPCAAPTVLVSGVMNYAPNVEGVSWFVSQVWPLVRRGAPGATLVVAGADPVRTIRRLVGENAGIRVTGTVADLRPYLWRAAVAVAPLSIARGLQTKVIEAVAAGVPAVVTTVVFEGLPDAIRPACVVADTPERFANAVLDLLRLDPVQRRSAALSVDLRPLRFQRALAPLVGILAGAAARGRRAA